MRISLYRIALAVLALYGLIGPGNAYSQPAPSFELASDSGQITLQQYRGKTVLLDFWASWCEPCRKSFAWMNKMQARYGQENFQVVAVNLDASRENAKKFLEKIPARFDIAYDPRGRIADIYQLSAMPSSFLINEQGEIVYKQRGFTGMDKAILEKKIRELVGYEQTASN